jgi:cobalt-zinc-cadmium efflux system protein
MGGVLIITLGWSVADPILGVIIGLLILLGSTRLLWKVVHILMEGTPSHLDLRRLCQRLEQEKGVTGVHDIHAWSITSGYEALSVHVTVDPVLWPNHGDILQCLREIASREFGLNHVTIQLEYSGATCAEDHHFAHPSGPSPQSGDGRGSS